LPPPTPAQVGMAAMVRDYGAGPVWDESLIRPDDVHDLGALAVLDQVDTPQIVDAAVTGPKLAAGSLDSSKWSDNFTAVSPFGFALAKGPALAGADRRWAWGMGGGEAAGNVG